MDYWLDCWGCGNGCSGGIAGCGGERIGRAVVVAGLVAAVVVAEYGGRGAVVVWCGGVIWCGVL